MRWQGRRKSSNVQDRRGQRGGGMAVGGGLGIVILIIYTLLGGNPMDVINMQSGESNQPYVETAEERELADFVSVVLADTEDIWHDIFAENNLVYEEPALVFFSGSVNSACGSASAATGPFYCPGDKTVYIDLSFYDELVRQFKAPGDFAMAYVVAHEVGHHVQNLLGTSTQVQSLRGKVPETEYNRYLKRLELQADFYAGIWAHYQADLGYLEEGDIEEAINAASAIGDDRIQKNARGYVVPDSFTHGTSEQRMRWFHKGYTTGDIKAGNTFEMDESEL